MLNKLSGIWRRNDGIRLSAIRAEKLPYLLAYLFELLLYTTLRKYLPMDTDIFGFSEWDVIYILHMAGSLVIMLLWSDDFKKLIYISVLICGLGLIPVLFIPAGIVKVIFTAITFTGLGGVVTCSRCGFAFATNNSEKAFGLIAMYIIDKLIRILEGIGVRGVFMEVLLPLLLFTAIVLCLVSYEKSEFEVVRNSTKNDAKGLYWALAYFILYFMADGKTPGFKTTGINLRMAIIGMVLGITVFTVMLYVFKLNSYHAWSVFFVTMGVFFLVKAFRVENEALNPFYYFIGNFIKFGWPLALYFLACAQKRFASYRLMKISTVVYVVVSPISQYGSNIIGHFFPDDYNMALAIFMIIIILIFLMCLPYSYRYLFSSEWISQMSKPDIEVISERMEEVDRFEKWNLSPRQKEVAVLLLAGKTRRQISGELKLSESTVKLHTSELYKKLNINSRIELFRIFGVQDDEEV